MDAKIVDVRESRRGKVVPVGYAASWEPIEIESQTPGGRLRVPQDAFDLGCQFFGRAAEEARRLDGDAIGSVTVPDFVDCCLDGRCRRYGEVF